MGGLSNCVVILHGVGAEEGGDSALVEAAMADISVEGEGSCDGCVPVFELFGADVRMAHADLEALGE